MAAIPSHVDLALAVSVYSRPCSSEYFGLVGAGSLLQVNSVKIDVKSVLGRPRISRIKVLYGEMKPVGFVRSLGNRSLSLLIVLLLHSALSSRC